MSIQKRYRTVVWEGEPNKRIGETIGLSSNERVVRENIWMTPEGKVRVVLLIRENVDIAKEQKVKEDNKQREKERRRTVFGDAEQVENPAEKQESEK